MVKRHDDIDYYGRCIKFAMHDDGTGPNSLAHSPIAWARRSVRAPVSRQLPPSQRPSNADQRLPRRQPYAKVNPSGSEKGATPDQRTARTPHPNPDNPSSSSRRIQPRDRPHATPSKSSSQLNRKGADVGPMGRRMGGSAFATKLTGGERIQLAKQMSEKHHDTRRQVMDAHQRRRSEREQLRQRRKAEQQQQQQRAQTKMASRRCKSYNVVDLTQTDNEHEVKETNEETKPEMVSDDEEDDDILRVIGKDKYPPPPSQKMLHVSQPDFWTAGQVLPTASTPLPSVPSACKEKEKVILLSSDDEKPTRLKRKRTRLYALSVSDPSFAPPVSENESDEPKLLRFKKSTAKRRRSPLRTVADEMEVELGSIENSRGKMHAAKDADHPQEKKSIDLKISTVPAFPKEINGSVDGVIIVSDEESSVQVVKHTPLKSGMKRLFEKRTIPPQSFYSKTTQTDGETVGNIHVPALKFKSRVPDPLPRVAIPLEPSDDEDEDVIECEMVTKQPSRLTLGDYEIPDYYIKEEPYFEPDGKRARDVRFRPLNDEELGMVASLSHRVPKQRLLVTIQEANIGLKGEDFGCLRGSRWLNDEILNSFAALINSRNARDVRSEAKCEGDDFDVGKVYSIDVDAPQDDLYDIFTRKRPRTHVFNTFFFPRLTQKGYDYNGVRRWLKRAGLSVLSLDLILVPINLKNFHWVLTAIDLRSKHFLYLDSTYGTDTSNTIPMLKKWLFDEVKDKHGSETAEKMGISFWRVHINPPYLPRQQDGGSCGVFTLYMADYLERGLCPNFTQKDIRNLRRRTILFLRDGYLPN